MSNSDNDLPLFEDYKDRIVAFIDLQGFANEAGSINNEKDRFQRISTILYAMKMFENRAWKEQIYAGMPGLSEDQKKELVTGFECVAVSDSVVISYPFSPLALMYLSFELAAVQWDLLWKWNYLIRGYISKGKCYMKNGIIFGEAYQAAYQGAESNSTHSLPYILLQENLIKMEPPKDYNQPTLYTTDHLDRYFINYASIAEATISKFFDTEKTDQKLRAMNFINKNLNNPSLPKKVREKYYWTHRYCSDYFSKE